MANWIKRHWILLVVGLVVVFLAYGGIDGLIAKHNYKKSIKEKDSSISELWGKIGESKKREAKWKASSEKNWDLAMEKESFLRKKDKEMRVKLAEKRALKKKIREMPVTQVIVRTIEIINCPDVVQQTQGILFSLNCSKNNLTVLEASFSLKKEVIDWTEKFNTSQGVVADLKNVIIGKDGVINERGKQLSEKDGIIKDWTGRFSLSEKRGKRSWWKGLKTGGIVGGILGVLAGFALGK